MRYCCKMVFCHAENFQLEDICLIYLLMQVILCLFTIFLQRAFVSKVNKLSKRLKNVKSCIFEGFQNVKNHAFCSEIFGTIRLQGRQSTFSISETILHVCLFPCFLTEFWLKLWYMRLRMSCLSDFIYTLLGWFIECEN